MVVSPKDKKSDSLIGQPVGGYVVERRIGQGGMGTVYELKHPHIGRKLALKVLHPEYASKPDLVDRFLREAKSATLIKHPNVVDVVDLNRLEDGRPYITMEYLSGNPLNQYLVEQGQLTGEDALELLIPICSALHAAHEKGVVHRDMKPENIFLVRQPNGERLVKVLDFGIAKMSMELTEDNQTRSGVVMGTPRYMSPEQAMGRTKQIDRRTDIYATGILTYQMLAGKLPFNGATFGDLLLQHLNQPIPPLPEDVEVDPTWNLVISKALAKSRADRFETMADFGAALNDIKEGRPPTFTVVDPNLVSTLTQPPPTAMSATVMEKSYTSSMVENPTFGNLPPSATRKNWVVPATVSAIALATVAAVFFIVRTSKANDGGFQEAQASQTIVTDAAGSRRAGLQVSNVADAFTTSVSKDIQKTAGDLPSVNKEKSEQPEQDDRSPKEQTKDSKDSDAKEDDSKPLPVSPRSNDKVDEKSSAKRDSKAGKMGRLHIEVNPFGDVYVAGKKYRLAPFRIPLKPGTHRVLVVNPQHGKKTRMVTIKPGKTLSIKVHFP